MVGHHSKRQVTPCWFNKMRTLDDALGFLARFTDWEQLLHRAPKRDTFDLGARLLLVTTDRQSAFDRVLAAMKRGKSMAGATAFMASIADKPDQQTGGPKRAAEGGTKTSGLASLLAAAKQAQEM